ncbi:class I SAM-dependent RNA methyltransferase [Brevundimonas sp.]|uniref:class I SAM-dependent RNA methyltransferase n=1 Tax=Brevundimonas sp. TaxID=1871086 RepID=UPI001D2FC33E|nr:class I SAM-dependent RNA methyltransferase [Brevundimonas sp.]MBL0948270.1 class I SAM-dependent RNA methyltransferase [Brevundimonas sp.]
MRERLTISHVGAQGDGVAPGPVFAPLTLAGEVIEAEVRDGRAEGLTLVAPSPERQVPPCPHFGTCGGCALQHWRTEPYLAWKGEQVRMALGRQGLETDIRPTVGVPPATRRRLALHARRAADGTVSLGFKGRRSWALVPIQTCVIADPRLVAALPRLIPVAAAFLDHPKSAPTLHVTLTETGLDVDVTGVERRSGGLPADRRQQAIRAAVAADLARLSLAGEVLAMRRAPRVRFGGAEVTLPPGGFLQAVPEAEAAMVARVLDGVKGAKRIADLFCGAGTFTFPLASVAPVLAADAAEGGIAALKAGRAGLKGLSPIEAVARDLFRRPLTPHDLKGIDTVVFDPPRAGAQAQVEQIAASGASTVVGVSCNPVTFARDARLLVDAGFVLEAVTPVDQFLWSAHVELVGTFRR